jgi:hypothetical protein
VKILRTKDFIETCPALMLKNINRKAVKVNSPKVFSLDILLEAEL